MPSLPFPQLTCLTPLTPMNVWLGRKRRGPMSLIYRDCCRSEESDWLFYSRGYTWSYIYSMNSKMISNQSASSYRHLSGVVSVSAAPSLICTSLISKQFLKSAALVHRTVTAFWWLGEASPPCWQTQARQMCIAWKIKDCIEYLGNRVASSAFHEFIYPTPPAVSTEVDIHATTKGLTIGSSSPHIDRARYQTTSTLKRASFTERSKKIRAKPPWACNGLYRSTTLIFALFGMSPPSHPMFWPKQYNLMFLGTVSWLLIQDVLFPRKFSMAMEIILDRVLAIFMFNITVITRP